MIGRLVLIAAILVGVGSGKLASWRPVRGEARGCLESPARMTPATGSSFGPARAPGLAVVHGGRLAMVSEAGDRAAIRHSGPRGMLRHATSLRGAGTAYVNDLAGSDVVVVIRPTGTTTIEGSGELTHPAWSSKGDLAWAVDLSALEVWSARTGKRRTVAPPAGAASIFSPAFTPSGDLVAIVGERVGDTHDEALNNLWRYDGRLGSWSRLTRFGADADRWSVLRTPLVGPGGAVLFVRVLGRATVTERPSFELWRLAAGSVRKVRDLPGEMYLAGFLGGRTVWNVRDGVTGGWRLVAEAADGTRVDLGCGAVSVDPVGEPDPDLVEPGEEESPQETGGGVAPADRGLAIVVGDFATEADARSLQEGLRIPDAVVIGNGTAPGAVRPGAWAVALPIPAATHPERALERFRARHPDLADLTWIVPFERGEVAA